MVPDASPEHYFTARPATPAELREIPVELAGRELTVTTAAGVFSGDRLDKGTAVLLPHLRPDAAATGDVLDLGCGWGPVALSLALLRPRMRIWAVDVNERALDLVRRNASRHDVSITARTPDTVPEDLRFTEIWSNPPIRIGKEALHALLRRWCPRLTPDGSAHLVVQKNLGADSLQAWIAAGGIEGISTVERVDSAKGFRILRLTH
ncbi:class I SAM-dependent methyltransferase [Kineococcus gynurae]|uniref:Class I SAM-dependent methyltransferase n=1 Tax=Kineococcus gynurae TaxID=452979 RepID=A0ABV5LVG9_9ACTN